MSRKRKFFKYAGIGIVAIALFLGIFITWSLFRNKAPITSGEVEYGIPYKENLKLDIYPPTKIIYDVSPVVFFIHGGAWIGGTKFSINFNRFNGAINTLRGKGYTIVSPNYTLARKDKSSFPECILDVDDAIDWTVKHAQQYNVDTTNMGLWGESAGAQIAMMIGFTDASLQPEKHPKHKFNYLVDIYGPNDLSGLYHDKGIEKINARLASVLGEGFDIKQYVFGFDPYKDSVRANDVMTKYSPVNFLSANDFPTLIIHGTKDQIVPVEQSITLKAKMDNLGLRNEIHLLDSVDHSFRKATKQQMDSTQVWISDFVLKSYRK